LFPFRMTNQLYRNTGSGRFEDVSAQAGAPFQTLHVRRGAAFGDIDNDGDIDVVIGNDAGPLELLINNVGNRSHWVGLRLVGSGGPEGPPLRGDTGAGTRRGGPSGPPGRDMLGARVQITKADGSTLWRRARADGSYASANDPRVLVGLGPDTRPPQVRVQWPDGTSEEFPGVPVDRWTTLRQGTGSRR